MFSLGTPWSRREPCEQTDTHQEQVLVHLQLRVVVSTLVLNRLGEHHALVARASLSTPCDSRPPETLAEGHADSVEAPGEFIPRGSEATDTQLDRLRRLAAVGLAGRGWEQKVHENLLAVNSNTSTFLTFFFSPSVFVLNC